MARHLSITSWFALFAACFCIVAAVSEPSCQPRAAPQQQNLTSVRTTYLGVPASPFGLTYSLHNNDIAFVSLNTSLGVLCTSSFPPTLLHQIPMPENYLLGSDYRASTLGIALTHNGRHILVAVGTGVIVVDVTKAVAGSPTAVVGALNGTVGMGAIEVTVTSDGEYAFLSQEYGTEATNHNGNIEVFHLHKPTANGSVSGTYIGFLVLGDAVVGTALSPDESVLYVTSELAANGSEPGYLSVLDVKTLKKEPTKALLSNVTAGCQPVRQIVSSDGKTVWVSSRASNRLLGFDAAKLISKPGEALIASVPVGTEPVGLTFAKDETRILTADSSRTNYTDAVAGLSVVNVSAALLGEDAVLGRIPTLTFPREFAVSPDKKTILVADYTAYRIQALDVDTIP